jgi:hypothetical protein
MEMSGQLHAPTALPLRYLLERRLGGPQSRSGRCGEEKYLSPAVKRVAYWAIPTELSEAEEG